MDEKPLSEQGMNFRDFLENDRTKGRSLTQSGYEYRYVYIFRACEAKVATFKPMDYVTRSEKFAREHADHQTAVNGEPYHVIKAMVRADQVFEAYNPGEYFYDGPEIKGQQIYISNL